MWLDPLKRAWSKATCPHTGGYREVQLGQALPGLDNPVYRICLDCGAVKLEDGNDG